MDDMAWECRDQADQAEAYYNHPLRVQNRRLLQEVMMMKKLLRERGIPISTRPSGLAALESTQTGSLPYLPLEIQLRILAFGLTSSRPIIDPFCKLNSERLRFEERPDRPSGKRQVAINLLATCKVFYAEGKKLFWSSNSFIFTSPEALKGFAELSPSLREQVNDVNLRIVARYYDDESRPHMSTINQHPDLKKPFRLPVARRPKEPTLARRGFRSYAYLQLIDFLDALLPPHIPSPKTGASSRSPQPRPRLFPNLQRLRMDFVNFSEEIFMHLPAQLHDLASHQLGSSLNELVLTGLPNDETGFRVNTELCGLLKDEGLLIDHMAVMYAPRMPINQVYGIKPLACRKDECGYSSRVVRAMPYQLGLSHSHHDDHDHPDPEFPSAPPDEGPPPESIYSSCRTIWRKIPIKIEEPEKRKWELYDRISGMPWDEIKDDLEEFMSDESDAEDADICFNCGNSHPFALRQHDLGSPI